MSRLGGVVTIPRPARRALRLNGLVSVDELGACIDAGQSTVCYGAMARHREDAQELLNLLETLYGELLADLPWRGFLRALSRYLESSYATLILADNGGRQPSEVMIPDISAEAVANYTERMFAADPFVGLQEGKVVEYADFVASRALTEEWRSFFEWSGAGHILGLDVRLESGLEARLRVTRNRNRPHFSSEDRANLQALAPHLRRALALHERLRVNAAEQGVYFGAMEQMAFGMIVLNAKGAVLRTNAVAERVLALRDGISVSGGRLRLAGQQAQSELDRLLRDRKADTTAVRLRVPRKDAAHDFSILARAPAAANAMGENAPALVLLVKDAEQRTKPNPEALREVFQLTRMEALLTAELADASSLQDAAGRLGISHNTARAHLRAIYIKTGAQRQSHLLRLVHSSLADLSDA